MPTFTQRLATRARSFVAQTALRALKIAGVPVRQTEAGLMFAFGDNAAGADVDEYTAMNLSAVWCATRALSEGVASLPLYPCRMSGRKREVLTDHPAYDLVFNAFDDDTTAMVGRDAMQAHAANWGNAYAEIERDWADDPKALHVLTPDRVEPRRTKGTGELYYALQQSDGSWESLPARDVIHVPGLGFDGVTGYSVVHTARESLASSKATDRYGANFFGNGMSPSGFLETDANLPEKSVLTLREDLKRVHGPGKNHNLLILTHGMKFKPNAIPPDDAQFLGTRQFNLSEVARWYRVPPHMLYELSRSTFNNIEHLSEEFVRFSLRPWMVRWEQELKRKLAGKRGQRDVYFVHDAEGMLRGDQATRYKAYAVGRQWGWLSPNDVREKENMPPLPGDQGDMYLVPVNMQDASKPLADPNAPNPAAPDAKNPSE